MKIETPVRKSLPLLQAIGGFAVVVIASARAELHFLEQFTIAIAGLYFAREIINGLASLFVSQARQTTEPEMSSSVSAHVPEAMRSQFASSADATRPRLMPWAVVGFVDIISSTSISNHIDLEAGFELKQRFLHSACERAAESGMIMLNHTGDGFLFLANYGSEDWATRLVRFHRSLTADFDALLSDLRRRTRIESESGLRFGVSCGPVLLGCLGTSATCFTAVGPDVNLASRLCDVAGRNEFVATRRVWDHLRVALPGWPASFRNYDSLRGFDGVINAVHVGSRPVAAVPAELLGSHAEPRRSPSRGKLQLVKGDSLAPHVSELSENRLETGRNEFFQNTISENETGSVDWSLTTTKNSKVM